QDPDGETLEAWLAYQAIDENTWQSLASRLDESTFKWDTRKVNDGVYRLRVAVTDRPSRPADALERVVIVAPVIIDNTKPTAELVSGPKWEGDRLHIEVLASDGGSGVQGISWNYPGTKMWYMAPPADGHFGDAQELAVIMVDGLAKGGGELVVRVLDGAGNVTELKTSVPERPAPKTEKEGGEKQR
ncbi:MAG: hypothetical protein H5T86_15800, partial [Armatimonadetes bacterium]|nr:hypothetical protein [Armatimonadota bacterium]